MLRISLFLILCLASMFSYAENKILNYAGFAVAGSASEAANSFPITHELLKRQGPDGIAVLESALWESVSAQSYPYFQLNRGLVNEHDGSSAATLAFLVDWENISREYIGEHTKLVADVHAQALVFDFSSRKVLASYPVAMQIIDVVEGEADADAGRRLIERIYIGTNQRTIFQAFAERLNTLELGSGHKNSIRVVSVELEDKALEVLASYNQSANRFKRIVADQFGKRLSDNLKTPYIPYSNGVAIGAKMAARFANGDVYQLELPEPDYRVHLTVRGFKKVMLDSTIAETAWAYGSYIRVSVNNFDDSRSYLDAPFKFGAVKRVPAGAGPLDDWSAFQESTFSLFDQMASQVMQPDRGWLEQWSEGRQVERQLTEFNNQVIQRSR